MYGMNSAEGAVVMYKDNRWWPICGESWTHTEAKIACKQLGFPYPYAESHSLPVSFGFFKQCYKILYCIKLKKRPVILPAIICIQ